MMRATQMVRVAVAVLLMGGICPIQAQDARPDARLQPRIIDGRNWFCPANADARLTITLQFVRGVPVPGPEDKSKPYHAVAKWRWWLARFGLPIGNEADN